MKEQSHFRKSFVRLIVWGAVMIACLTLDRYATCPWKIGGWSLLKFAGVLSAIRAGAALAKCLTHWGLVSRAHKPAVEGEMVGRLYELVAAVGVLLAVTAALNKLGAFGAMFAAFGGMLLGWSLQAPVSGFAAWVLISMKRPFRPGDRVQLPNLGLTGDVKDVGMMYTVLNQVGGSIGSEEAVGRHILVPNAMLFSQVVINYTVMQDSPYMLDEIVVRITYDSDWNESEKILVAAAEGVTRDIIEATKVKPYIRSDMYDYGIYLRLRYMTRVKDRAEIAYELTKKIFVEIQNNPLVDIAIPFIYSYRAALDRREDEQAPAGDRMSPGIEDVDINWIRPLPDIARPEEVEQLAIRISKVGLLQPIIVNERPEDHTYEILVGHTRFEACKKLGWATIPAVVQNRRRSGGNTPGCRQNAGLGGMANGQGGR